MDYRTAGVDVVAGRAFVERIRSSVESTRRPEVVGGLGGFGGLCRIPEGIKKPLLVSGTDGVGTKLKLAFELEKHDTIGIDLVAMCVNDILVQGAEPLYFLDYLACGKLHPDKVATIVSGISEGCRQSNCALIGGETAEMPGMYSGEDYDLAGFAVGVVEKEKLINGEKILPGDQLIGLPSSGIHSNGFSLVRKILEDNSLHLNQSMDAHVSSGQKTLGEVLLEPTRIYVRPLLKLMQTIPIKGMVHVTGGGLPGNLPRMLPEGVAVELDSGSWENLPVFDWLQEKGNLSQEEMLPVFNMGIGFVICLSPEHLDQVFSILHQEGEQPVTIGKVISGNRNVIIH